MTRGVYIMRTFGKEVTWEDLGVTEQQFKNLTQDEKFELMQSISLPYFSTIYDYVNE